MKTSRQRILEYIRQQRAVTIGELSQALHSSEANIRHHLNVLQERGLVTVVGERPAAGRGRPTRLFGPAPETLGDNLDLLADALLAEIAARLPDEAAQALLQAAAGRIGAALQAASPHSGAGPSATSPRSPANSPPAPGPAAGARQALRLLAAVQQLNLRHYQAHWEPHPDAPRIIINHCPFAAILERHPYLCRLDAELLANLLGQPVEQTARLLDTGHGARRCIFRLQPRFDI
ncbi:MAG: helix-turn-helix transcriptional regulator [Chloroflexota bacterium]